MSIKTYQKLYIFIILMIPILYQYSFGGGLLDLDVVAMALIFFLTIVGRINSYNKYRRDFLILLIYTILITVVNLLVGTHYASSLSIILRAGRYCLYIYLVLIRNINLFDFQKAMKIYRVIVYFATVYIIIQAIFYYGAGITLPNVIGSSSTEVVNNGIEVGRLRSFYSEPAAMAYSMIPFVICSLFGDGYQEEKNCIKDAIVGTTAIILTTSGQGILCALVVWAIWFVTQIFGGRLTKGKVFLLFGIVVATVLILNSSIMQFSLGRVFDKRSNGAVSARKSGYVTWELLNPIQMFFGTGYGNYVTRNIYGLNVPYEYVNYSSIAESVFTTGILGTLILLFCFVKRFFRANLRVKVIFIAILVLALGGCPLTGNFFPLFLSFAFCKNPDGG